MELHPVLDADDVNAQGLGDPVNALAVRRGGLPLDISLDNYAIATN